VRGHPGHPDAGGIVAVGPERRPSHHARPDRRSLGDRGGRDPDGCTDIDAVSESVAQDPRADGRPQPAPTAAPTPAPTPSSCVSLEVYVVVAGDTLSEIAKDHGVSLAALPAVNPQIRDRGLIRPRDRTTIPPRVIELAKVGPGQIVPSHVVAFDMNKLGQVVGQMIVSSPLPRPRRWIWPPRMLARPGVAPSSSTTRRGRTTFSSLCSSRA
jgi:LysM repeat protein